jgi:cytochrome P450
MARVETLAPAVTDATGRMLRRWSTTAPASIDIAEEMNHLICGIALRVLFHVELDEARQRKLTAAMVTVDRFLGSTFAAYLKPAPNLSPATLRNYREAIKVLDDFAYSIIADRSKQAERPDDLLSLLVSDADTGKNVQPLTTEQIRDEVITLLTAALLTTSSALSWAWILLGRHPVVEARFHQELDTVLAGRTPTAQDLLDLVYTRMVFDETLRLYPPVWAIERRAECEQNIGGYTVPADARVLISAYTTHRHPEFWPDPETFDPSRFAPDAVHERASFAYFPEAILVLATVGQVFRLLPLPDQPVVPDPMVTLQVRHGCLATVEARRSE